MVTEDIKGLDSLLEFARKEMRASLSRRCLVGEFRCKDSPQCIPKSKRCDGYKDCKNGEDEPTSCGEF